MGFRIKRLMRRALRKEIRQQQLVTETMLADKTAVGGGSEVSFFPIWAEENSSLNSNTWEWAFGNGANTPSGFGVVMYVPTGYTCHCVAMGARIGGTSPYATIELEVNAVLQGTAAQVELVQQNSDMQELASPLEVFNGDRINFHTDTASGTGSPCAVVAWFKMEKA